MPFKASKLILSIFLFLVQGALIYVLYTMFVNLRDGVEVTKDDLSLFRICLVSFSVISLALCIWCLRVRTHSIVKLFSVLAALGIILLSFNLHYKSMDWPYQVRLKLVNGTGKPIEDLRLSGCMDIDVEDMGEQDTKSYELPVTEGCEVWLVNRKDSVKIVEASAGNVGFRKEYTIR